MKSFKLAAIAVIVMGLSPSVFAVETDSPATSKEKTESMDTMLKIDIQGVLKDTSERSDSRTTQDLNANKKSAFQSAVDLLTVKAQVTKLEYIEANVPIEVRVQGMEASLAWIEKNAAKEKAKEGQNLVWSSSDENLYVPIGDRQTSSKPVVSQPKKSGLTDEDIKKLKELGLVVPGEKTEPSKPEQPAPAVIKTTERAFISASGVDAKRVVVMGENKHFSGDIFFDISLSKGKETTKHSLSRAKIGEKFSVNGVEFVVADLSKSKISILNLETSEVANFNI